MSLRGILKVKTNQERCAGQYDEYKHHPRSTNHGGQSKSVTFHAASLVVYDDSSSSILSGDGTSSTSKKPSFAVVSKHYFPPLHQHQRQIQRPSEKHKQYHPRVNHHRTLVSQHHHHGRLNNRGNMDVSGPFTKPHRHAKIIEIEEPEFPTIIQEQGQRSMLEDPTNFDELWNDDGRNF